MTDYIVKDSGARESYPSGMVRDTQEDKPKYTLIPLPFLTRLAMLYTRGAKKYGERNWEKADSIEELERFKASAFRHLIQWLNLETDEDHAAAVTFNLAAAEAVKTKLEALHTCNEDHTTPPEYAPIPHGYQYLTSDNTKPIHDGVPL